MKPHETSVKERKLSEPAVGVLISISAFLLWFLLHTFGPNLSEIVPLKITLVSAGSPVPDATVSVYYVGAPDLKFARTDANGQCSTSWRSNNGGEISIKVTKSDEVLFDDLVKVSWNRKLRLAVDKDPLLRGLRN